MDCRTTSTYKFIRKLEFKQYIILAIEQSVLTEITSPFQGENMETQYNVLGYRIELHFHDYEHPIEIDENGHNDRNVDYEIRRPKVIE